MFMKKRSVTDLLIYVVITELIGALSAILSGGTSGFFEKYQSPPLMPPKWIFPVVWAILYAIMGISAYLIHSSDADPHSKKRAMNAFWAQLAVNFIWSIVFFGYEQLWLSVVVIYVLLILIIVMIIRFRKINYLAGNMNIPYLIWVMFAAYLNTAIAVIN
jgi:tryptophan-rich sensory protein